VDFFSLLISCIFCLALGWFIHILIILASVQLLNIEVLVSIDPTLEQFMADLLPLLCKIYRTPYAKGYSCHDL
jgi:hypothetical protein